MRKSFAALLAGAALLGACGSGGSEGGLTAEENDELNEAAAMLDNGGTIDASADSLVADPDAPLGNGEAPADTGELPATEEAAANAAE